MVPTAQTFTKGMLELMPNEVPVAWFSLMLKVAGGGWLFEMVALLCVLSFWDGRT